MFTTTRKPYPSPWRACAAKPASNERKEPAPATRIAAAPVASAHGFDFARVPGVARTIQCKAAVGAPGDPLEREADAAADKVMRMTDPAQIGFARPALQRKCATCDDAHKIQAKRAASANSAAELDTGTAVRAIEQGGAPLSTQARAYFEPRFGHDFSGVRVHAGDEAASAARGLQARAYTCAGHIVFGAGEYAPSTTPGKRLLAHELAHVVQQGADAAPARNAPAVARNVEGGNGPLSLSRAQAATLQRVPADPDARGALRSSDTLPYRQAKNLAECTRIMGPENFEYCQREVLGDDTPDAPLAVRAGRVSKDLTDLIAGATWKEIRKRAYPRESAPAVQRARERKAGRLPDMTGLGAISSLEHFAASVRTVQRDWSTFSPDRRVDKLGDATKAEMTTAEVPPFLVVNREEMKFKGFFRPDHWSFTISDALVTAGSLNDSDAAELANTALHESRHAEQQFLAARFSAGVNRKNAAGIHAEQKIPVAIAEKAVDKKFNAATDPKVAALGREMFAAKVTHGAANQRISSDDGIDELDVRKTAAETALRNLTATVTSTTYADATARRNALRAQIAEVERKYTLYRNIPYEADAHEVGDAAELAFKGWR